MQMEESEYNVKMIKRTLRDEALEERRWGGQRLLAAKGTYSPAGSHRRLLAPVAKRALPTPEAQMQQKMTE